jgi:hypothetical protein
VERHRFQAESHDLPWFGIENHDLTCSSERAALPSFPKASVPPSVRTEERGPAGLSKQRPVVHGRIPIFEDACVLEKRFKSIHGQLEFAGQARLLVQHDKIQPVDR